MTNPLEWSYRIILAQLLILFLCKEDIIPGRNSKQGNPDEETLTPPVSTYP